MKIKIKKFLFITLASMLLFSLVGFSGCNRLANLTEDDFSLTISVNSTTIRVGEYLEIETVFENLSGMNLNIRHRPSFTIVWIGGIPCIDILLYSTTTLERGETRKCINRWRAIRGITQEDIELGLITEEQKQRANESFIRNRHLPTGEHQITVMVRFIILNRNKTEYLNALAMYSNTVTITVI